MKYVLLLILLVICACSSFQINESGVRKACKAGVEEYDDGSVSFKCFPKHSKGDTK